MPNPVALIVDDERDIRALLSTALSRMGLEVIAAENVRHAKQLLTEHRFDVCLTDMRLGDGSGIDLIRHVSEYHPHMPIAMITAYGDVQSAVNALKAGAYDFVSKPVNLGTLQQLVEQALALREPHHLPVTAMVGESKAIHELRKHIERLARNLAPILITGEAGVGKHLAARQIHQQGPRHHAPFIALACDALEPEQRETALFGRDGAFIQAQGGTLFLAHVDALPLPLQLRLQHTIQARSLRPAGSFTETRLDVRILSASRKDLLAETAAKRFREDLLYRINVIALQVPPLRERREDIPLLAQTILATLAEPGSPSARLSEAAKALLQGYSFPGNVRELENLLERAHVLAAGSPITAAHLQFHPAEAAEALAPPETPCALPAALAQLERAQIQQALESCRFNKTRAAAQLGITFRALRYKMEKLGME